MTKPPRNNAPSKSVKEALAQAIRTMRPNWSEYYAVLYAHNFGYSINFDRWDRYGIGVPPNVYHSAAIWARANSGPTHGLGPNLSPEEAETLGAAFDILTAGET